tara:strand:- start:1348 stop:1917 length:570 start_codon:yes stop_codon:yes gene_type:complete
MNQSDLYNYSILTGVWNDLDYDVLLMVKEYLRVYLNRKMLNKDYDEFLDKVDKQVELRKKSNNYYDDTLIYRHGLKSHLRSGFLSYKGFYIHKCIDCFARYKYFILGTQLFIDNYELDNVYGTNDKTREHLIACFKNKYNEYSELGLNYNNLLELNSNDLKMYIKTLMKEEDKGFVVTIRDDYILRWTR